MPPRVEDNKLHNLNQDHRNRHMSNIVDSIYFRMVKKNSSSGLPTHFKSGYFFGSCHDLGSLFSGITFSFSV